MNLETQISYWVTGAAEDLDAAKDLLKSGRYRHALFWGHLSIEKMLKAFVTQKTKDHPPKIHNLVRLSQLTGLSLDEEQINVLHDLNMYQMGGRYPDTQLPPLNRETAYTDFVRINEVFQWLNHQLEK